VSLAVGRLTHGAANWLRLAPVALDAALTALIMLV